MRQGIIAHATLRPLGAALSPAAMAEVDALAARQVRRLADLGLQTRSAKPRAMWLRTNQIIATPGTSERHVIAMTMPMSV